MHINLQPKAHLFEDGVRLIAARFFRLLSGFVLELAEIHDLGDGRLGIGSYLNQIQVCLLGKTKGVFDAHHADLLAGGANESDFGDANSVIGSGIADAGLLGEIISGARYRRVPTAVEWRGSRSRRGRAHRRSSMRPVHVWPGALEKLPALTFVIADGVPTTR